MSAPPAQRLAKASAILALAMLTASAANYGLNLALARMLDQREFGDASLMVTWMLALTSVAVAFQLVTVTSVAGRTDVEVAAIRRRLLRPALIIGFAAGALLCITAEVLQDALQTGSAWPFRMLGLGIPLYLGQAVDRGIVQARSDFGRLAASYVAEAAVRIAGGLSLVVAGFGVAGTTLGLSLSFAASWIVVAPLRRTRDLNLHRRSGDVGRISYSAFGPMALLLGAQVIINNGDVMLSKMVFSPEDAGLYAAVALVGRAVFFVSWAAVQVVFPSVASGDDAAMQLVNRATIAIAGFGLATTVGATLFNQRIADLFFGNDYGEAAALLGPYAAATSMFAVVNLIVTSDIGRGVHRSGWLMLGGAVAQTALLAAFAENLSQMVWLQIAVMFALAAITLFDRFALQEVEVSNKMSPQSSDATADRTSVLF